jgi:hypothetical protein
LNRGQCRVKRTKHVRAIPQTDQPLRAIRQKLSPSPQGKIGAAGQWQLDIREALDQFSSRCIDAPDCFLVGDPGAHHLAEQAQVWTEMQVRIWQHPVPLILVDWKLTPIEVAICLLPEPKLEAEREVGIITEIERNVFVLLPPGSRPLRWIEQIGIVLVIPQVRRLQWRGIRVFYSIDFR